MTDLTALAGTAAASPSLPAATIGKARLMRGAVAFKDAAIANLGDTYRAQIQTDGGVKQAIVKDIPLRELANELMAAALALELGLPIPPPYIVLAEDAVLKTKSAPQGSAGSFMFGSADLKVPSVAQIVVLPGPILNPPELKKVIDALIAHGGLGSFYGFDAWAANVDRHLGNMLLASNMTPWLIDHGRCFTGQNWVAADLVPDKAFINRMKEWLTPRLNSAQKTAYAQDAQNFAMGISNINIAETGKKNGLHELFGPGDFNALVTFLGDRTSHTPRLAADSLGLVI